jgi:acetylornithine deacetylase
MNAMDADLPSQQTLEILQTLIGFDTTSRNSNLGLIEWARDRLQRQGATTRLTYDDAGRKANLFATLGEGRAGGWVLSGHTDVVPVDGQDWHTDPFRAEVIGDRVHGRGSCDMKGFIACALAAVPAMLGHGGSAPFHIALSYDEEVGCIGVRSLLADLREQGILPDACIVGEPTDMQLVIAQKGRREMRCCVQGKEAHSSLPRNGVNAIEFGARIIAFIQKMAERESLVGARDQGFDVPYSTVQCGTIHGGLSPNMVPRDCEFSVEVRYLPQVNSNALFTELQQFVEREVLPEMQARHPEARVGWSLVNDTPGFEMNEQDPLVRRMRQLTGSTRLSRVAYNTEAGLFKQNGIPTLICGPGNIAQAHRPDEYVELSQLAACDRFLQSLIRDTRTRSS